MGHPLCCWTWRCCSQALPGWSYRTAWQRHWQIGPSSNTGQVCFNASRTPHTLICSSSGSQWLPRPHAIKECHCCRIMYHVRDLNARQSSIHAPLRTCIKTSALVFSPPTTSSSPGPSFTGRMYTAKLVSSSLLRALNGPTFDDKKPNILSKAATCVWSIPWESTCTHSECRTVELYACCWAVMQRLHRNVNGLLNAECAVHYA